MSDHIDQEAERESEDQAAEQAAHKTTAYTTVHSHYSSPSPSSTSTPDPFNLRSLNEALQEVISNNSIEPFPLLFLPPELRLRIFEHFFFSPRERKLPRGMIVRSQATATGLQPEGISIIPSCGFFKGRVNLMLCCRQIHEECSALLYSTQSFKIFAHHHNDHKPTLDQIPLTYKPLVKTAELVFGPDWTDPKGKVTAELALPLLISLRRLKVYVECDPEHPIFAGFRRSKHFYTAYAERLLRAVLRELPQCVIVEFDGGSLVEKNGPLMRVLYRVARGFGARIEYGPDRGWNYDANDSEEETLLQSDSKSERSRSRSTYSDSKSNTPGQGSIVDEEEEEGEEDDDDDDYGNDDDDDDVFADDDDDDD
ncbi:hypothetical protein KEM54_002302 [Ascosphaera aggregata]|nr:hypothetical protein KEM54_002302 [Ascosphaera aggregata]